VMRAVAQGSSEEVLRLVDKLLTEGHSPAHFARQMVRFLRNTTVAKIAGADSSLLQISGDERQRVARAAELFNEEDLARHLQIMLRTHGEIGYRTEQRFHLELGLLKMAHAQRLLPIEQLLSDAGLPTAARPAGKPAIVPEARKAEGSSAPRAGFVSPFAADSARKSKTELSSESNAAASVRSGPRMAGSAAPVVMGSAAPAAAPQTALEASEEMSRQPADSGILREAVLRALSDAGHHMLVSMLEAGEWKMETSELVIQVASSATVIDMSLGADAKRLAIAAASGLLGKPVKLRVIPGGTPQNAGPTRIASNGSGRSRAEQDPIVRRMREKFGAEIRTIIDYRDKR
jgi:DNA polymerase III subunit gamma/tau